jgi:hypothetical protein
MRGTTGSGISGHVLLEDIADALPYRARLPCYVLRAPTGSDQVFGALF